MKTDTSTKTTVFNDDGSITDKLDVVDEGGLLTASYTINTSFNSDGSIDTVVS